jgi:hypothetical protein
MTMVPPRWLSELIRVWRGGRDPEPELIRQTRGDATSIVICRRLVDRTMRPSQLGSSLIGWTLGSRRKTPRSVLCVEQSVVPAGCLLARDNADFDDATQPKKWP